jgi:hypothetical protein
MVESIYKRYKFIVKFIKIAKVILHIIVIGGGIGYYIWFATLPIPDYRNRIHELEKQFDGVAIQLSNATISNRQLTSNLIESGRIISNTLLTAGNIEKRYITITNRVRTIITNYESITNRVVAIESGISSIENTVGGIGSNQQFFYSNINQLRESTIRNIKTIGSSEEILNEISKRHEYTN